MIAICFVGTISYVVIKICFVETLSYVVTPTGFTVKEFALALGGGRVGAAVASTFPQSGLEASCIGHQFSGILAGSSSTN